MNSKPRRILIGAAVGVIVLALAWGLFRPTPLTVEVAKVERGALRITVDGEGRTRSHDRFVVTAPVSGKMSRVALHEGDSIPLGFVITGIDPNPQRPTEPRTEIPGIDLYAYKVYAPAAGRVSRIFEPNERIVQAGTPILEISKPGKLEIVVDVLSTDAVRVRPGAPVLVENWGGGRVLRARVRTIEPQAFTKLSALGVEEQRVNVVADFLDSPEPLGDNYRVEIRIVVWEAADVLKIQTSALFRAAGEGSSGWRVFVAEKGKARLREIDIGHRGSAEAEVLGGLSETEEVILHPPNQLADGTSVYVKKL
jgi:multidrug efflux pump subunit AcrA (membrane-fusion protein)